MEYVLLNLSKPAGKLNVIPACPSDAQLENNVDVFALSTLDTVTVSYTHLTLPTIYSV